MYNIILITSDRQICWVNPLLEGIGASLEVERITHLLRVFQIYFTANYFPAKNSARRKSRLRHWGMVHAEVQAGDSVSPMENKSTACKKWNLRREDTLGTALLSSLRRLSSSRRLFNILPCMPCPHPPRNILCDMVVHYIHELQARTAMCVC